MPKQSYFFCIIIIIIIITACQSDITSTKGTNISITPCPSLDSMALYEEVLMQSYTYSNGKIILGPTGIRLGSQTAPQANRLSVKTNKGIHAHLVIDSQEDTISNSTSFEFPISNGKHQIFAFLATSYFESIKKPEAIIAKEVEIRDGNLAKSHNLPYVKIVYNCPTGVFKKEDASKILLDFVLVNTKIAPNANHVRVTIDEKVFLIDTWQAYYIEGAEVGEHTVKLELIDATGKQIDAPISKQFIVTD